MKKLFQTFWITLKELIRIRGILVILWLMLETIFFQLLKNHSDTIDLLTCFLWTGYQMARIISIYQFTIMSHDAIFGSYQTKRAKASLRMKYRKLAKKTKEFDLFEFLTTFSELEFLENIFSKFVKKYFPRFHSWGNAKLESLCECKEGQMFNSFTGSVLVLMMGYASMRTMLILLSPHLILLLFFYF